MHPSKGVSPLVATVILIAFVVAIAAIAAQFITSFTQQRQSEISSTGKELVDCANAAIDIILDSINYSAGDTRLTLTIENIGRTNLALPEIVLSNTTLTIPEPYVPTRRVGNTTKTTSSPLKPGEFLTIHNNTIGYRPDKITVRTSCPGVHVTAQNDTTTNKFKKVFD